jgi:hypothetical protein
VVPVRLRGEVVGEPEVPLREVQHGADGGLEPFAVFVEEVLVHQPEAESRVFVHFPREVRQRVVLTNFVTEVVAVDGEVRISLDEEAEVVWQSLAVPDRRDQADPAVAGHERAGQGLDVRVAVGDLRSDVAEHLRSAPQGYQEGAVGVDAAGHVFVDLELAERPSERDEQLSLGLESLSVGGGRGEESESEQREQNSYQRAVHGCLLGSCEGIRTHRNR